MKNECPKIKSNKVYEGNSIDLMKCLPDESVDLIMTSPPYANARKKHYNSVSPDDYKDWFLPFAREMKRVLKDDGNFVLNIKDQAKNNERHPYVFETIIALQKDGWMWNDTYIWNKPNPMPRKPFYRFKNGFEYIFHFKKKKKAKFYPERVMHESDNCREYENYGKKDREDLIGKHGLYRRTSFVNANCKKAYPSNVIEAGVAGGKSDHPARFPPSIPAFFIDIMSNPGDVVLDPFAGSGTTNAVAKEKCRKTIGFDLERKYVDVANKKIKGIDAMCER